MNAKPTILIPLGLLAGAGSSGAEKPLKPNVIFILADDYLWTR